MAQNMVCNLVVQSQDGNLSWQEASREDTVLATAITAFLRIAVVGLGVKFFTDHAEGYYGCKLPAYWSTIMVAVAASATQYMSDASHYDYNETTSTIGSFYGVTEMVESLGTCAVANALQLFIAGSYGDEWSGIL